MEQEDATGRSGHVHEEVGIDEFLDDPELRRLHEERIASIKEVAERRARKQPLEDSGHGIYSEIKEGEFLTIVTKTERVVCHFFHQGFERCQIMDKHLKALAEKYVQTRFVKLNAPASDCNFGTWSAFPLLETITSDVQPIPIATVAVAADRGIQLTCPTIAGVNATWRITD